MKNPLIRFLSTLLATGLLSGCPDSPVSTKFSGHQSHPLEFLPALKGDYFRLDSVIIERPYHIYTRLPEDYDPNGKQLYPVIYLLDGDSLFPILATNHLFMHYDDYAPEAIIVGIAYGSFKPDTNRRSYDFSLPDSNGNPERGGAAQFLSFLEQELLPVIESRYPADPQQRILFGQSRGGHFVLYSAFTKPDLFKGLIASNPTFLPQRKFFKGTPAPATRSDLILAVTSGSKDIPSLRKDALTWHDHWISQKNNPWRIAFKTISAGTHAANSTDSYRFGINEIFKQEISLSRREAEQNAVSADDH
ncbi:alpha/beta hydrolase-fold protein [Microbulbifer sp. OS29]|uniref:Alpha/beta hydrolase-fold protein n=1 Tax=Microbulbifer okhotskensis TaxID=2926617 RepID=A0A9X2J975_9GAMM|nr:alpha/beta hydrolase-fold protein [Microbulbifer okhotskensis]MCO1336346.1 alpha/beta hydrolase-fold protein [Microbulbifer okhotskensis]